MSFLNYMYYNNLISIQLVVLFVVSFPTCNNNYSRYYLGIQLAELHKYLCSLFSKAEEHLQTSLGPYSANLFCGISLQKNKTRIYSLGNQKNYIPKIQQIKQNFLNSSYKMLVKTLN